jgi:DNA invertase Pin-like site-specific DNA recombinase
VQQIPVVELLRVSTADQADEDRAGLPRQEEANRRTVARHSLHVIRQYRLIDVSGAATLHAPEIQEMLGLIRAGQARGIVTADFDRLLRPDDFRSLAILQDIKEASAFIYLPDQVLDLNTQAGFLMSGLQSVIAGNELAQIKKRMLGAKEEKRRQGKHPGNHLCLPTGVGYDRQAEAYFYTPEASRVSEAFELFHAQGVQNLYELGRRTGFSPQTLKNLLRNELYIGWRHYKQKRAPERRLTDTGRRADRRKVSRAPHEAIRVQVIQEPLIQEGVFWEVQEILAEKTKGFTARRAAACDLFLFKGMLRCGHCGSPMYTTPGGKAGPVKDYYYCRTLHDSWAKKTGSRDCPSGYLRRSRVEDEVNAFISEKLASRDYILDHLEQMFSEGRDLRREREIDDLKTKLARLEKKRKRALALHLDGILEREDLDAALAEVAGDVQRHESKLGSLTEPRAAFSLENLTEVVGQIAEAFALFPCWDKEDQRRFLASERPQFWIQEGRVTRFTLPLGSKKQSRMGRGSWPPPA